MNEAIDTLYREAEERIKQEKDRIIARIRDELRLAKQRVFKS
ncbi:MULTISPECIES: hypothetical protein [Candidatus Nitrosocaldus]|jgi:hypothetical protein|uniref:Uncharacterized protein n=1 Tax=Candidatus Nitrosocaldus cavascurensis TaxID=2058097 RepID=A0A2K5ANP6_9ARCH|nr:MULTISPECIES: hypothetical protein [Candidatus Nitrosocaldus]SPC33268.1 protein of unknown function [Candidatus Nitrosocaldus cavascurensis]